MSALEVVAPLDEQPKPGRNGGDARGSARARRRQREWLVQTYRADVDVITLDVAGRMLTLEADVREGLGALYGDGWRMACRCFRCGRLLTVDDVTRDRIIPGVEGGRYRRDNLRPACSFDNSSTGGSLGAQRRARR